MYGLGNAHVLYTNDDGVNARVFVLIHKIRSQNSLVWCWWSVKLFMFYRRPSCKGQALAIIEGLDDCTQPTSQWQRLLFRFSSVFFNPLPQCSGWLSNSFHFQRSRYCSYKGASKSQCKFPAVRVCDFIVFIWRLSPRESKKSNWEKPRIRVTAITLLSGFHQTGG